MVSFLRKKYLLSVLLVLLLYIQTYSQQKLLLDTEHSCSYYGEFIQKELYGADASRGANQVISKIMGAVGLKPRFEVYASSDVPNAAAVIHGNKRFIIYNSRFMSVIQETSRTNWAAISILAHEIGHHLNGHTLEEGGSRPAIELEADEFSGFVLRKMGASLTEAQAVMQVLPDESGSYTHPARNDRLEAIAAGWKTADSEIASDIMVNNKQVEEPEEQNSSTDSSTAETQETIASIERKDLVGKVVFNATPAKDYFLTTQLNLITVTPQGVEIVGKLVESGDENFPYIIYSSEDKYVYVASDGLIYNAEYEEVGYTSKI